MAIKFILNKKTGEVGYQATVKNKSRYFSAIKYGKREARKLAKEAEVKLCESFGLTVAQYKRTARFRTKPKGRNPTAGVFIQWEMRKGSKTNLQYAAVRTTYISPRTQRTSMFSASIHKHGLENAIALAFAARVKSNYPVPDFIETLNGMKEQLLKEGKGKPYREACV